MSIKVLGLDISKLTATYWILDQIPEDPKRHARKSQLNKLEVSNKGREALLAMDFDFAVLEPTGVYSRIWRHWLEQAGRPYRLVGHKQLGAYRDGWGLQKTDKLDGLAMSMYGIERHNRPGCWLIERDRTLSDLVLYLAHLNEQKNGFQNNLRQKLVEEIPEWHSRKLTRNWGGGVPGMLNAIADNPTPKWEREIRESCGMGLSGKESAGLARILIQIEQEEILAEHWIDEELCKLQYESYLNAAIELGFSRWLTASIIAAIYPFEQFLNENGKRRTIHTLTKVSRKRVYKDESLRSFKLACGMGLVWIQSGDFEGWVAGGSGKTRENLRNSIQAYYLQQKKKLKAGNNIEHEHWEDLNLMRNKFDNQGMMKVARRWIEQYYSKLVREFKA